MSPESSDGKFKRPAQTLGLLGSPRKKMKMHNQGSSIKTNSVKSSLLTERQKLPIFEARSKLLVQMQGLQSAIVIGETGSGKTTQIPQYLYEAGLHRNHMIACTQPRRVAAITVAKRVAQEKSVEIGNLVGYCVRFDDMTSENTKIKYMTDGMLLREAILDPLLKRYSVIILDEAHERTVHTDVLFGVIKKAQKKRKIKKMLPLKVIVMSATMDVDHFSQYFNQAPVLYLEGRLHPIKLLYTKKCQSDYIWSSIVTIFQIHKEAPPEDDILVFLTGQEEIDSALKTIRDIAKSKKDGFNMKVLPLYAALPAPQQLRVFERSPPGHRKVILSTNIAETSVTISGIKYVVDTGKVKSKSYHASSGLDYLRVQSISQAQAWQRMGRAGRESPGTCYRLYTEQEFNAFRKNTIPEIQRSNLASVLLQLLAMGIKDVRTFDFMDKPTAETVEKAMEQLKLLQAIEEAESVSKLTDLGRDMAAFPLSPNLAKCILQAVEHQCLDEVLSIVSMLYVGSIFFTPDKKKEQANEVRKKFLSVDGDHITLLNVYRAYKSAKGNKEWCYENYINMKNIKQAMNVRQQLRELCLSKELSVTSCGRDTINVRKCLTLGFFMNTAELQKDGHYLTISMRKKVQIHPSSALFQHKPAYVLYNELVQTTKCYMRDACVVDKDWLRDAAPSYFKRISHWT